MCIAAFRQAAPRCPLCGAPIPPSPDRALEQGCRGIRLSGMAQTIWFCPDHPLNTCMEWLDAQRH